MAYRSTNRHFRIDAINAACGVASSIGHGAKAMVLGAGIGVAASLVFYTHDAALMYQIVQRASLYGAAILCGVASLASLCRSFKNESSRMDRVFNLGKLTSHATIASAALLHLNHG